LAHLSIHVASAQAGQAELTGEVRDQSGAVVPNAKITATETRSNQSYLTTAGASGVYTFTGLKPGLYTVTVEVAGFKRYVHEGVHLTTGEKVRLDAQLEVGAASEIITIKADATLLRSESGSLGQVISNRKIVDLPLNGRTFLPLVALAPGVALPPASSFPRLNGGRPRTNEYLFDGISVLQPEPGQVAFFPIIDAIQEFKVETNSPPAEFGRFNGGVINLTTKSGTNEFHGSAFEFFRNEVLNARNLFAPKTASDPNKPVFRRNQFGFVLGGPVIKDKTFFFVDYQATRQLIGRVRISTVPTLLQRKGIFTEPVGGVVPRIFDPATTKPKPGGGFTRDPFAGNQIPMSRIDPVALALLNRYPLPTSAATSNNFRRVANESDDQDQFDIRIDQRFSDKDQIFGRYSYAKDLINPVTPLAEGSGNITSGATGLTDTRGQSFASNYLHIFNPRLSNELRFGYTRRSIDRKALLLDAPPSQSLKLPGIPSNAAFQNELPTFVIDGFQQLGPSANTDSDFRTDVTEIVNTVSLQRGRHSIKTGLDFRWERLDIIQPPSPTGSFRFS
ncbi:MAG TPA: carboxypeptidase-like regulatory domain-containing protein, partial [Pyrinomonadaceae bacterium]|nr:carboxypeptidase-like regulatory domain-containing protein [Pyrinomonadaceae bacterium]